MKPFGNPEARWSFCGIPEVASMLREGRINSTELTEHMLERIARFNPQLNAFITVSADTALEQAGQADRELAGGLDRGPLHGIPIAIKDLIATRGIRTSAGTLFLKNWIPQKDAEIVKRLKSAGAVLLGKTGMDELAWGSTSVNPHYGDVRNPWITDFHPGGSSGGSAAAVAAGLAYAAVGTDTGCSIRQPAHCCGIVGLKPTFGLVSTLGVTPLVPSMDHVGPLARNVCDVALMLEAMADLEPAKHPERTPQGLASQLDRPIVGARIGVTRRHFFEGGSDEVKNLVEGSLELFLALGADVIDIELPGVDQAFEAARMMFYEIRKNYSEVLHDQPELLSHDLKARMDKVFAWSRDLYESACETREEFLAQLDATLEGLDALVAPTSTVAARPISESASTYARERWKNTSIFNLAGLPSVSVPCGFNKEGLPIGLMITGHRHRDFQVLKIAFNFERAAAWHRYHPTGF